LEVWRVDGVELLARIKPDSQPGSVSRPGRKAILVVGMSRSGTSLVSHILHVLGCALPRDVLGGSHGNPLGHWEPAGLVAINDAILHSLDRCWDDPRPLPRRWLRSRAAYRFQQRIVEEIGRSYGDADMLMIKDPRLCRLLPLYLEALDVLNIEPLVILQVRPMTEVAQSLTDRDVLHPGLSELLWLRSLTEAEWYSRSCQRVWVSFGQIKADWQGTARRIGAGLGLSWPVDLDGVAEQVGGVVKPRRHMSDLPGFPSRDCPGTAQGLSARAWDAVEDGLVGDEPAAWTGFDRVRAALADADRMYLPSMTAMLHRREAELAAMRASTCWRITAPVRAVVNRLAGRR
jgi:hypothetical protein